MERIEEHNIMKCPSFERIIDFLDSRLPESEKESIAAHLASNCSTCVGNRDWYRQVSEVVASDDSLEPPAWVTKRAIKIFEGKRPGLGFAARLGNIIASLAFDSLKRPALAGVRSTETANRQLLYQAADYSIDLQITSVEHSRVDLVGQVLKQSDPTFQSVSGLKLDIMRGADVVFSAVTSQMGDFKISGIDQGVYGVRIELPEGNIIVSDVPVSET